MRRPHVVHHPYYVTPLPARHTFPMGKYARVLEHVLREGIVQRDDLVRPDPIAVEDLHCVHDPGYVDAFVSGTIDAAAMRRIGLPWSRALVQRSRLASGGTLLAARLALRDGVAVNLAGGTHHAFTDFGSGYCVFNDLAVAARTVQAAGQARRVLVIDLDVHQGDGTAEIFRDDPSVFTFSMHCEKNFPARKRESDLDVALAPGVGDAEYLDRLHGAFERLNAAAAPDLVLYDAGVDPHRDDRLGRLDLSDRGIAERDRAVIGWCVDRGLPVACVLGGGYSENLDALARRHASVVEAAGSPAGTR